MILMIRMDTNKKHPFHYKFSGNKGKKETELNKQ